MYIFKGEKAFSILNIDGDDMAMVFDALNYYRLYLEKILKEPDDKFREMHKNLSQDKVKVYRELFKNRIKELDNHVLKIQKLNQSE